MISLWLQKWKATRVGNQGSINNMVIRKLRIKQTFNVFLKLNKPNQSWIRLNWWHLLFINSSWYLLYFLRWGFYFNLWATARKLDDLNFIIWQSFVYKKLVNSVSLTTMLRNLNDLGVYESSTMLLEGRHYSIVANDIRHMPVPIPTRTQSRWPSFDTFTVTVWSNLLRVLWGI